MRHRLAAMCAAFLLQSAQAQNNTSLSQSTAAGDIKPKSPVINTSAVARRPCTVPVTYMFTDSLGNVLRGLSKKDEKWFAESVSKKYPEVCYVSPETWANLPPPAYVFFVNEHIEKGITYDTETRTSTQDVPVSGSVKNEYGETVGKIEGTETQTTTTQTTTPRETTKHVQGLYFKALQPGGSWKTYHVFPFKVTHKQNVLGMATLGWSDMGVSQHRNLLQDAAKWIHEGGLTDSRHGFGEGKATAPSPETTSELPGVTRSGALTQKSPPIPKNVADASVHEPSSERSLTALTNLDVIRMVKAGLADSTVLLALEGRSSAFDISPNALIELKNAGVSQSVLDAMLRKTARPTAATSFSVQPVELKKSSTTSSGSPQGWIGISTAHFGSGGAVVTGVIAGGPAAQAGLKSGDVINEVNGISLKDENFDQKIAVCKPGTKVRIGYMRGSWAMEATVTVGTSAQ